MFAKVFTQILDSSLADDYLTRLVFEDFLKLCDLNGVVDITPESIARRTNVPLEIVRRGIANLEKPDPRSRMAENGGRRIIRLDEHREWGWLILNYKHYRNIASEEQRREKTLARVRAYREKEHTVTHCNACNAMEREMKKKKKTNTDRVSEFEIKKTKPLNEALEIYAAYPLHVAKPVALAAIAKAMSRHPEADLLEKTRLYATVRGKDKAFIPHPSTWFNQDRFLDDPETWKPKAPAGGVPKKREEFCG